MDTVETFTDLGVVVAHWPQSLPVKMGSVSDNQRRLLDALTLLAEDELTVSRVDVASLARHVLRNETERRGHLANFRVPADPRLPHESDWKAAGIRVTRAG